MTVSDIEHRYNKIHSEICDELKDDQVLRLDYCGRLDSAWVNPYGEGKLDRNQLKGLAKVAFSQWAHKRSNWPGYRKHRELAQKIQAFIFRVAYED